jgi:hypothetical protein
LSAAPEPAGRTAAAGARAGTDRARAVVAGALALILAAAALV